jgi:hypothetical protein
MESSFEVTLPPIRNSDGNIIQPQKKRDQFFAYHITAIIKPPEISGMNMVDGFAPEDDLRYKGHQ